MLEIKKNIPLPERRKSKYPFEYMELWDMFEVPEKNKTSVAIFCSKINKLWEQKFVIRTEVCYKNNRKMIVLMLENKVRLGSYYQ